MAWLVVGEERRPGSRRFFFFSFFVGKPRLLLIEFGDAF